MSTINEQASPFTVDPKTEPHLVIGDDRSITVPETLKNIAVQYDHAIETVTFDCPRYWDNHDLSAMVIYINYQRADGQIGCAKAENVIPDDVDQNLFHFDWTITRNVTAVPGPITFGICIKNVDAEGIEEQHWNSVMNKEMQILPGMECGTPIEEEYPDILTQLASHSPVYSLLVNSEEDIENVDISKYKVGDIIMVAVNQ